MPGAGAGLLLGERHATHGAGALERPNTMRSARVILVRADGTASIGSKAFGRFGAAVNSMD